eukprot:TRINITY_DN3402_c0_g1_i1.p1 TRINITY_DN3402_c0_g1~~TRINITY_DN3402_c0_g1_i1.p1  ORF type:complete len:106 (+),score=27.00 TRINITY_DN3402_c0_g1_i1:34-318(+)
MTAIASELRLADHFPRHPKPCAKPADAFFACFSEKGEQPPEGDKDAGKKALAECEPLMRKYDACMFKLEKKKPQQLIRVQEEYRALEKDYKPDE